MCLTKFVPLISAHSWELSIYVSCFMNPKHCTIQLWLVAFRPDHIQHRFLKLDHNTKKEFVQYVLSSSIWKCTSPLGEVIVLAPQTYQAMEFFLYPGTTLDWWSTKYIHGIALRQCAVITTTWYIFMINITWIFSFLQYFKRKSSNL